MDTLNISGYGFDVTDLDTTVLTKEERNLFDSLLNSESNLDARERMQSMHIYYDVDIALPSNSTDFQGFIYIFNQPVVGVNRSIKTYSYAEANRRLTGYFNTFMYTLDKMTNSHPDNHHSDVFLSMMHKLSSQITKKKLPSYEEMTDYC